MKFLRKPRVSLVNLGSSAFSFSSGWGGPSFSFWVWFWACSMFISSRLMPRSMSLGINESGTGETLSLGSGNELWVWFWLLLTRTPTIGDWIMAGRLSVLLFYLDFAASPDMLFLSSETIDSNLCISCSSASSATWLDKIFCSISKMILSTLKSYIIFWGFSGSSPFCSSICSSDFLSLLFERSSEESDGGLCWLSSFFFFLISSKSDILLLMILPPTRAPISPDWHWRINCFYLS